MTNIPTNLYMQGKKILHCWLLLFACCLFAGCTTVPPGSESVSAERAATPQTPLDYYAWAKTAPESLLQVELDKLETTLASYSLIDAVRASTILITSELADNKTEQQALILLTRAASLEAKTDNEIAYKVFGEVLQAIVQERQNLQSARTTNRRALTEIDDLKKRNTELEQQIEELTSIERQIIERERLNTLEP